jgi:hypothetical protein
MLRHPVSAIGGAMPAGGLPPAFPEPSADRVGEFPLLRCKHAPLTFGYARFKDYQALIRRLNAGDAQCLYLLVGVSNGRPVAREGRTGAPLARLAAHLANPEFRHFTHVAVIAGPQLAENDVKALECLVARQIATVGVKSHQSKGAETVNVSAAAWNAALDAFLFLRDAARAVGIDFLEPASPGEPAGYWNCAAGIRDRWLPGAVAFRKTQIAWKSPIPGPRFELVRGDFIAIAAERHGMFWLLAGSEIRATAVPSARKAHSKRREHLLRAGQAAAVAGYPDRLELRVDLEVGASRDALTKFVTGSLAGFHCWRPFTAALNPPIDADVTPTL